MKIQQKPNAGDGGFSLVQLLTVIAIGGVLSGLAASAYYEVPAGVAEHELRSDVRTINNAVEVYQAFGGDLNGVNSPAAVLAKLQTVADATSAERIAGLSGSMLDRRLRAEMLSESEADSGMLRANWDASERRFVVATEGENGVARFTLDESLAGQAAVEEARNHTLKLSGSNGWIWEYGDQDAAVAKGPTQILSVYAVSGSGGGGMGPLPPVGGGAGTAGGGSTSPLDPPLFSIPTGHYPVTDYNLQLELTNPNASGVSRIIYKVNSGPWSVYYGTPITVEPYATVTAFAETVVPTAWANSEEASEFYCVEHVQLDPPVIVVDDDGVTQISNPNHGHGNNEDGVDVSNPGEGEGGPNGEVDLSGDVDDEIKKHGKVKFKVNGNHWQDYEGPFQVGGAEDHIVACVIAEELYFEDSAVVSADGEVVDEDLP